MSDELREKIAEALAVQGVTDGYICDKTKAIADSILALFAPVLADAEKWRKFLAIPSCNDCPAYPECPCDETNCPAIKIENAFEGNREEKDAKML